MKIFAALLLALFGLTLSGCDKNDAAKNAKELTVYSAMPVTELPVYFNAFEKSTGIKVNYVRLSAGEMVARVLVEKAAPGASVMHGGPSDLYIAAANKGVLEAYRSGQLENTPAEYRDPAFMWSPIYVGALAFACNTAWFAENKLPLPKSWQDLTRPELQGQISMAHPATSGTSYTIMATIIQMYANEEQAWQYLAALNKNIRQYTKSGTAPAHEAALGEVAVAIVFAHDALKPKAEGYPIEVVFPAEGTGYEVGAVALIKNARPEEGEAARLFIDWLMSVEGQNLYIESKSNRLPVNKNAKVAEGLVPLHELHIVPYDAVWAGENKDRLTGIFKGLIKSDANLK